MTNDNFLKIGDRVSPVEGCTTAGHFSGVVLDIWLDLGAEFAEIRWNDGSKGTWPTGQLVGGA